MRNIKCSDCEEYRNNWCERIIDSPHPDMLRDCRFWHQRKDMVEIIRCKDCKHWDELLAMCNKSRRLGFGVKDFCSKAERKAEE